MVTCDLCKSNEATKEVHFLTKGNTKKYTDVCEFCFPKYKQSLIESLNLTYKGYHSLQNTGQIYLPMV